MPHLDHLPAGGAAAEQRSALKRQAETPPGVCRCGEAFASLSARVALLERLHRPEIAAEFASVARPTPATRLRAIVEVVASHCGITVKEIMGKRRTEHVANARMLAYYLQREATEASFADLGRWWGNHHGTILNGHRQTLNRLATNPKLRPFVDALMGALGNNDKVSDGCRPRAHDGTQNV